MANSPTAKSKFSVSETQCSRSRAAAAAKATTRPPHSTLPGTGRSVAAGSKALSCDIVVYRSVGRSVGGSTGQRTAPVLSLSLSLSRRRSCSNTPSIHSPKSDRIPAPSLLPCMAHRAVPRGELHCSRRRRSSSSINSIHQQHQQHPSTASTAAAASTAQPISSCPLCQCNPPPPPPPLIASPIPHHDGHPLPCPTIWQAWMRVSV